MNQEIITWGGWVVGLLTVVIGAVVQWRKGKVDESALVLGKWKELVEAHQAQISALNKEITSLRERLVANEKAFADYRRDNDREKAEYRRITEKRIRDLEEENAGLKRAIAQNSSATVYMLGRQSKRATAQDDRITTIEDTVETRVEIDEGIHKLGELGHNSSQGVDDDGEQPA